VFREFRHAYSAKPNDINAYRRHITYPCGHIGTKELEIVLRDYLTLNSAKMTYGELEEFEFDALDIENPQM
jgi:succinate dehydrogenase flavin-adding protein (antitoxin of CptAB toxin-antitoxin module)